ncbi:U box domain protein [Moelleriella libera RCEF 2490]|uniref:U box domain protein n=1 Tax=Moelleriella libera RCEF 2490 TaxID=1081109 RepID=A0A168A1G2_9HYPO|nr:U box domain protein [Moelleriella libera RCEF 2490]
MAKKSRPEKKSKEETKGTGRSLKVIIADPQNATLYTNRAMARLKLGLWDSVIADCEACLAHDPSSMKAHYYMSQALLAIGAHGAALQHALTAHAHCASKNDKSLGAVTAVVLRCKKEGWEHKEKLRAREAQALEREVLALLARDSSHSVDAALEYGSALEADDVREEAKRKKDQIRDIFERARADAERKREVPEWAIDDISFGVMVDPVITKTGKSYERASIMEHLRRHPSDPLTREPLLPSELRPNLALRQACNEFLEQNGWAVDW